MCMLPRFRFLHCCHINFVTDNNLLLRSSYNPFSGVAANFRESLTVYLKGAVTLRSYNVYGIKLYVLYENDVKGIVFMQL
jgi:hypothetical protein